MQEHITTTTMAIRESLMRYFKGDCVETLIAQTNIRRKQMARYTQPNAAQEKSLILAGDTPLLTVHRLPDTVIFHQAVLGRSPQLREVRRGLEVFLGKYLPDVERKEKTDATFI